MRKDEIGPRLDRLALRLMNDVEKVDETVVESAEPSSEPVPPGFRLDVFKAVSTYYVNVMKAKAKIPPGQNDDEDAPASLDAVRERLRLLSGGKKE